MIKLESKMNEMYLKGIFVMKEKFMMTRSKKEKGVNGLVVEIGILIVAVVLLALFNKEVGEFFKTAIENVTIKCNAILESAVSPTP